ncbi:MAG: purine-nucleoside phosphorylase [Planctomycetes bacterium]|nr:purine-nucleoside phosphorylase [Planctomycetota bacterium]
MSNQSISLKTKINEAADFIRKKIKIKPAIGIILGTGLGGLAKEISQPVNIPYGDIPHFPVSTVVSHKSELKAGLINGRPVVAMEGRFHFYEGYSLEQITLPIRVIKALGASSLIISSAVGGLNKNYRTGDLILIEDHINLMGVNPLIGPNDDSLGPRFPDMSEPYDKKLIALAEVIAQEKNIKTHRGVYAAMTGPNLETRAEYRFLQRVGADLIGMSTVPEVIVGVHAGLRIFGLSVVTDICLPETLKPTNITEIIATANRAEPKMTTLIKELIKKL